MRIAIIECDSPATVLQDRYTSYVGYFKTLLSSSISAEDAEELDYTAYAAYADAPLPTTLQELEGVDGILFTGSKYNSYDDDPWILRCLDLIRLVYGKIKMVGICFGHQIIARALGGTVARNPKGWEIAVTSTTTFQCDLLPTLKALRLQQMHRDIVTTIPPGSTIVGSNEICEVQALYDPGKYFSVQGHPEYDQDTVEKLVTLRVETGIVPVAYGEDAFRRASLEHDGLVVGRAIFDFFRA